ncbi:methyltransferase domain-containing protein [Aquimarina mytili]|uniref:Methyltransferase domain-containing protein n=1 Tax=Aquimarina mytili TaxID=874423 RepID=A0A936ZQQ3_9FLAO|nr:methyltransferase domain-containing protein [Aquimarina mytili]MBL0682968.1 methyltransferase domain-containing protein [Aquimarina mytili]
MFINLVHRSNEPEIMDDVNVEEKALKIALADISRVNKLLGGNSITIKSVDQLMIDADLNKELTIVDIGCGDGEILRVLADLYRKKNITVKLIGVDLNEKSLELGKKLSVLYPEISYYKYDILKVQNSELTCDIILCTLTLHHFSCKEIKGVIRKAVELASVGVVINDLHRSKLAYYLFKLFSLFFIKGYIAKNDGLVSIKRGFKKKELLDYAKELNLQQYSIDWRWAFRYRWVIKTKY